LLQNRVKAKLGQAAGPKKLKTENTDEVTILNVPLPVVWPLEQEVNVVDVSCGSRHTIVLLGKPVHCFLYLKLWYFCPDRKMGLTKVTPPPPTPIEWYIELQIGYPGLRHGCDVRVFL
jgi:hypothetical protein